MSEIKQYIKKMPISLRIMGYCMLKAISNRGQTIVYTGNPIAMAPQPAVPWLISMGVILFGIASWCAGEKWDITGLSEAARAMVYVPLSYMFGKSTGLADAAKAAKQERKEFHGE